MDTTISDANPAKQYHGVIKWQCRHDILWKREIVMDSEDMAFYRILINALGSLLNNQDRLGVTNLPLEFGGVGSDLLNHVNNAYSNDALLLLVDGLIQDCEGKSEQEILQRFELLRSTLLTIYERCKKIRADSSEHYKP